MTTKDSFDAEPAALEDAVFEHRFDHVLAAGRRVAAGWRSKRRNEHPVKINRNEEELTNVNLPFRLLAVGCLIYFSVIFFKALHIAFSITLYGCSSLSM